MMPFIRILTVTRVFVLSYRYANLIDTGIAPGAHPLFKSESMVILIADQNGDKIGMDFTFSQSRRNEA